MTEVLLWLFVINLGIACGAGLYESRIVVPRWLSHSTQTGYRWNPAAVRDDNTGLRFWVYVTTVPLTLLTLASLVAAWWTADPVRSWWLASAGAALIDRFMTVTYFIPTMLKLMREEILSESKGVATALLWVRLGYVRHAVTLMAWLAALKTLSLMNGQVT